MIKRTILLLFPILFFSISFAFSESHAQDLGETERYHFFVDEIYSHEIMFQSHLTKFTELVFDSDALSIKVTVESDSALADVIFVHLDTTSFDELFSKNTKILPTDLLVLLDGTEQEYEMVPTSQEDLIVWKFNSIPHVTEIKLIKNPDAKERNPDDKYPYGLSPIKQIKNGAPLHAVKCSDDDKVILYKLDMTNVACVSEKTQSELVKRGWGVLEEELSSQNREEYLCDKYQGNWTGKIEVCKDITTKQCSLMRGVFQSPHTCAGDECVDYDRVACFTNLSNYYQQIEGKEIFIEGLIIDRWGGSKHRYHFFTNEPYMKFNTGSGGIKLDGIINQDDDLNGKIVMLSGVHTKRDLSIRVDDFEVLGSIFPIINPTSNLIHDVSMWELTGNPDMYYNQTVRVAGMLTEHEHHLVSTGVGCSNAMYTTSDEFSSDFPSSRQLSDGEGKRIGVRIGSHNDLGKVENLLPFEYKYNPVEIQGLFVPNLIENVKGCKHVIHKSGYILTEMENIHILKPSSVYELNMGNGKTFAIQYEIDGGTVGDMVYDENSNSLTISIDSTGKGSMILNLPVDLVDGSADNCNTRFENVLDDDFFVLVDKYEVDFDEFKTTFETRTLKISFPEDSESIEIIGTCLI